MHQQRCRRTSQLVLWYRDFLDDGKAAAFVSCVSTRYSISTLCQMVTAPEDEVRRATILALGMVGGAESIGVVGRRLNDPDRCVRLIAEMAFADLVNRQMGAGPAMILDGARRHLEGHRYRKAGKILAELTSAMPAFAEAWHLRAAASFHVGQYASAIKGARQAVEINPCHFLACTLEARCWLELNRPGRALRRFEESFSMNPSQVQVQGYIDVLRRKARRINSDDSTSS